MHFTKCDRLCKYNTVHISLSMKCPICDLKLLYRRQVLISATQITFSKVVLSNSHERILCHSERIHARMGYYQVSTVSNLLK